MPSTCPHCSETFPLWMMYQMHLETHHKKIDEPKIARQYTKAEKAAIVERGERRIGKQHFIGGSK